MKSFFLSMLMMNILFSQIDMNFSYEMQYGNGTKVEKQHTDNPIITPDYSYFQNILDMNTHIGDNVYVFTQLEYSNPPIYGYNRTTLDSLTASFYLEFSNERLNVKIGDQYELYGRGLSYYSFQDQNVDYDNSVMGVSLGYHLNESLTFSTLIGSGEYYFRSNPTNHQADYKFDTKVGLGSVDYEHYLFGYFQTLFLIQEASYSSDLVVNMCMKKFSDIGKELNDREGPCTMGPDKINIKNLNFNWNHVFGPFDIYLDKSWIIHDKILADETFGSRFYASIYFDFFGAGITYEHKNYHTPYLVKSLSNPPIVYREGSSILASRNSHSMNFGNEIGHQIDINKSLSDNLNLIANFSMSYRHEKYEENNMVEADLFDIVSMENNEIVKNYFPFRQIYMELNGWTLSDQLYYKIGLDHFMEYLFDIEKYITAFTIPTQGVLEFQNGSSMTMYLEMQNKIVEELGSEFEYENQYVSLSYSYHGKWILTGFLDQESKDGKYDQWLGSDISWKINTKSMVSLFYGSQKGGLVCANGICAEQPGFDDGLKLTFRTLF